MAGYDFLNGVRVVEVAQLGPSSLGGYLADMGADVIKVEGVDGDPVRRSGTPAVGGPDGLSLLHLRWNRGKRSIGIDLKTPEGAELFTRLVHTADIVIEGMRAGVLDRLGLGYDVLRAKNPRLVFCSISGLGTWGPYHELGSHGPSFDAFGGLSSVNPYNLTADEQRELQSVPVGMHAMGLHAALGTLAAYIRAQRTGEGAVIEVAAADSAAHWRPDGVDTVLNAELVHERPGFKNSRGRMAAWPRLQRYDTRDGRGVFFQALSPKFWVRFCAAVGRPDLLALTQGAGDADQGAVDERVHAELCEVFRQRDLADWMELFRVHDVPGGPANTVSDLAADPHFLARDNVYAVDLPDGRPLRLTSTPVKAPGQKFAPALAPEAGQDTDEVLSSVLGVEEDDLRSWRRAGVVF